MHPIRGKGGANGRLEMLQRTQAECGAVKYGVTRDHVVGLEVVLPTGDIVQLGGKVAKNSSGYSLLHLLIGSEVIRHYYQSYSEAAAQASKVLSLLVPVSHL